jgi:hypothetical protein
MAVECRGKAVEKKPGVVCDRERRYIGLFRDEKREENK